MVVKYLSEAELESLIKHEKSKMFVERLIFIRSIYTGEEELLQSTLKKIELLNKLVPKIPSTTV